MRAADCDVYQSGHRRERGPKRRTWDLHSTCDSAKRDLLTYIKGYDSCRRFHPALGELDPERGRLYAT